ncbi:non-structural maintenance of chromosomes element 3 homolog [Nasonia vitripennis]|uniref:MAGE domain-containing protein n=1 Tax=Nasonia vitripennis TaxID=7425 RepID=A0A7M7H5F3_NASVI|nr:non-structural maintenance of chromosomes element 3 homolog [Nasonia vitripennis]XP_016837945.1 non-structural maintenance of chromosomes element 3 homolog [Nasonia vitripennis]
MPRRRTAQKSLSQPSTSARGTQHGSEEDDEDVAPPTQNQRQNKTFSDAEHGQHVANAVRYILAADQFKTPINRSAVSKAIDCHGAGFRTVMNSAEKVLQEVFGYRMVNIKNNETSSGKFILVNKLQDSLPYMTFDKEVGDRYVLLFLVLSHIFMNGEICSEASLMKFLLKLGIIEEGNMLNELYGNVMDLVTKDFVKERYIRAEATENSETQEKEFSWGERALEELSPRAVMEFVSKMYAGDREMSSWPQQHDRMQTLEQEHHHDGDLE